MTPPLPFGKRILVLAAHPDDEVVACCTAIRRAKAQGAEVFVHYLTNGCIARQTLWRWQRKNYESNVMTRMIECIDVARELGLTLTGFSDRPARHLWRNLSDVYHEIEIATQTRGIDQLWVPAYEGGNADHDGLNGLAARFKDRLSILEFAEYNYSGGKAHSNSFLQSNGSEITLTLTREEAQFKKEMLKRYVSEQGNLGYVKTVQESFRPLASYDYTRPPHEGTLWYARFHWVPFKHPRVDFTKPEQVCWAITSFSP